MSDETKLCECGCGQRIIGRKEGARYASAHCKMRAANRRNRKYDPKRTKGVCVDCGADISHRHGSSLRCEKCRQIKHNLKGCYDQEFPTIKEVREALNLPQLRPSRVSCLRCGRLFHSWDRSNNRICQRCHETMERAVICAQGEL